MAAAARTRRESLSGPQKCAVLCIALGPQGAARILQQLSPDEVERVSREIAGMPSPDPELVRSVVEEFRDASKRGGTGTLKGGPAYAQRVLDQALGAAKARPIMERVNAGNESGLGRLRRAASETLAGLLRDEHPQTIALVLAHLDDHQALSLLRALEPERANEVAWRVAAMGPVSPATLVLVEQTLMKRVEPRPTEEGRGEGGASRMARLLNRAGESLERSILESLEQRDSDLAARVRNLMFTFEDLLRVDPKGMQRVLREVDTKELATALKVASDELKAHIRKAMSERAAAALDEEIEMLGPTRVKDVETAHARIIESVRSLAQAGEITIEGQGGDDAVV
ncbi:MAG TPA: flagellar motor switch protein FliG [Candidatus Sulfotelmatobacter sp.]|nr:flagellar motor switch protein FliG [Candidatus Sulfotelmatobacter sp.]